jgi:hypothetical protein
MLFIRLITLSLCLMLGTAFFGCQGNPVKQPEAQTAIASTLEQQEAERLIEQIDTRMQMYRCRTMIAAVNCLRRLGKDGALKTLDEYNRKTNTHDQDFLSQMNVICICRVLFVPPEGGWDEPWSAFNQKRGITLVRQDMGIEPQDRKRFPLYPMVLSNGIPFVLNMGYYANVQGPPVTFPDEAKETLDRCRDLKLIPSDLSTVDYDQAVVDLLTRNDFKTAAPADPNVYLFRYMLIMEAIDMGPDPRLVLSGH